MIYANGNTTIIEHYAYSSGIKTHLAKEKARERQRKRDRERDNEIERKKEEKKVKTGGIP